MGSYAPLLEGTEFMQVFLQIRFFLPDIFIQSFISACAHGYLFYNLVYNPILFYFVTQIVQLWPLGSLSCGFCVPLTHLHHSVCVCMYFLNLSALQCVPGSSRIFPVPVLESAISAKILPVFLGSFC